MARAPAELRRAGLMEALRNAGVEPVDLRGGGTWPHLNGPRSRFATDRARGAHCNGADHAGGRRGTPCSGSLSARRRGGLSEPPRRLGARGLESPPTLLFVDGHEERLAPALSTMGARRRRTWSLGSLLGLTLWGLPDDLLAEIPTASTRREVVAIFGPRDGDELTSMPACPVDSHPSWNSWSAGGRPGQILRPSPVSAVRAIGQPRSLRHGSTWISTSCRAKPSRPSTTRSPGAWTGKC